MDGWNEREPVLPTIVFGVLGGLVAWALGLGLLGAAALAVLFTLVWLVAG